MGNPDCHLQDWEAADCPKLGLSFEQITKKVTEIYFSLNEWTADPRLSRDRRMEILDILCSLSEIVSMLGDLGFPYEEAMREHREVLEALRVPKIEELDGLDEIRNIWLSRSAGHQRKKGQTSPPFNPKAEVANA